MGGLDATASRSRCDRRSPSISRPDSGIAQLFPPPVTSSPRRPCVWATLLIGCHIVRYFVPDDSRFRDLEQQRSSSESGKFRIDRIQFIDGILATAGSPGRARCAVWCLVPRNGSQVFQFCDCIRVGRKIPGRVVAMNGVEDPEYSSHAQIVVKCVETHLIDCRTCLCCKTSVA
jgi:hypothetical protein